MTPETSVGRRANDQSFSVPEFRSGMDLEKVFKVSSHNHQPGRNYLHHTGTRDQKHNTSSHFEDDWKFSLLALAVAAFTSVSATPMADDVSVAMRSEDHPLEARATTSGCYYLCDLLHFSLIACFT